MTANIFMGISSVPAETLRATVGFLSKWLPAYLFGICYR